MKGKKRATQAQYFTAFMLYQVLEEHNWCPMDDRSFHFLTQMIIQVDEEDRHAKQKNYEPCTD